MFLKRQNSDPSPGLKSQFAREMSKKFNPKKLKLSLAARDLIYVIDRKGLILARKKEQSVLFLKYFLNFLRSIRLINCFRERKSLLYIQ